MDSPAPDLSLIVPCYQEEGHLRESVAAVLETLEGTRLDYELVFVDDASSDATRDVIEAICAGIRCPRPTTSCPAPGSILVG